jgi:hypothetical protein
LEKEQNTKKRTADPRVSQIPALGVFAICSKRFHVHQRLLFVNTTSTPGLHASEILTSQGQDMMLRTTAFYSTISTHRNHNNAAQLNHTYTTIAHTNADAAAATIYDASATATIAATAPTAATATAAGTDTAATTANASVFANVTAKANAAANANAANTTNAASAPPAPPTPPTMQDTTQMQQPRPLPLSPLP